MGPREQTLPTFARESTEPNHHHHLETDMKTDLYSRMYARLEDLIPGLSSISAPGASFYAPPRAATEMALFCSVSSCDGDQLEIELARDEIIGESEQPSHWMKFRLDRRARIATLVACQQKFVYETVLNETIYPQSRHLPLNSFAVNWLGILVNLHFGFQTIVPTPSFN